MSAVGGQRDPARAIVHDHVADRGRYRVDVGRQRVEQCRVRARIGVGGVTVHRSSRWIGIATCTNGSVPEVSSQPAKYTSRGGAGDRVAAARDPVPYGLEGGQDLRIPTVVPGHRTQGLRLSRLDARDNVARWVDGPGVRDADLHGAFAVRRHEPVVHHPTFRAGPAAGCLKVGADLPLAIDHRISKTRLVHDAGDGRDLHGGSGAHRHQVGRVALDAVHQPGAQIPVHPATGRHRPLPTRPPLLQTVSSLLVAAGEHLGHDGQRHVQLAQQADAAGPVQLTRVVAAVAAPFGRAEQPR